jgi:hypothetical protein
MYQALIEPFAAWKFWIDIASAACAFGAAAFWLRASLVSNARRSYCLRTSAFRASGS